MIVIILLIISLILLSIVAFNMSNENFALGYKPPTRAKDLSYNVHDNGSTSDNNSKLTNKSGGGFSFDKPNWNFGGAI
jgi:hypothetical protein